MDALIRSFALIEVCIMLICGLAMHLSARDTMIKPLWMAGWGFGWVLICVVLAVGYNLAASEPLTIGIQIFAAVLSPAVIWVVVCTAVMFRAEMSKRADIDPREVQALLDELDGPEHDCSHPSCQRARRVMNTWAKRKKRDEKRTA